MNSKRMLAYTLSDLAFIVLLVLLNLPREITTDLVVLNLVVIAVFLHVNPELLDEGLW